MPRYRKLAQKANQPDKQEFAFQTGQKNPHPKPEAAKLKMRKPKLFK